MSQIFHNEDEKGMEILYRYFDMEGPNEQNFVLFSTDGEYGNRLSIEDIEAMVLNGFVPYDDQDEITIDVTYVIVMPRIPSISHGNCLPKTVEDFDFLKYLRRESQRIFQTIGMTNRVINGD